MPIISSIGLCIPPYQLSQDTTVEFAEELFQESFKDLNRLLKVFENGNIEKRHFTVPLDWFKAEHSFSEKNDLYIQDAVLYSVEAVKECLHNKQFLTKDVDFKEIAAIVFVSSSGISTPSIDAKIMNMLPFDPHTKRIPLWGLGCAGGASGLSRAYEYCKAFPSSNVLVISVELCSLTFQRNDRSKSNLVGTSLFADGVSCCLVSGDKSAVKSILQKETVPVIKDTQSTLMSNSEDVMGWDIRNEGFHVIFSKDIPAIIRTWLKPNVESFLNKHGMSMKEMKQFVAHPGGKKVLEAYQDSLQITAEMTKESQYVLSQYGNMSSATIFYVLKRFLDKSIEKGDYGIACALGPGFSSELLLLQWE